MAFRTLHENMAGGVLTLGICCVSNSLLYAAGVAAAHEQQDREGVLASQYRAHHGRRRGERSPQLLWRHVVPNAPD
jgi:hypothetical protein